MGGKRLKSLTDEQLLQELFSRTTKVGECLLWNRGTVYGGYGAVNLGGKLLRAHRVVYNLVHGTDLLDYQLLRHTCDNPGCINPDHLLQGTQLDNMNDMKVRGRVSRGEKRYNAKLTLEAAKAIIAEPSYVKTKHLAEKYGISRQVINDIRTGRSWKMAREGL